MNNSLERRGSINPEALDGEFYFQSLLEQARQSGLLTGDGLERLQRECLELLAERAGRLTGGLSSSIPMEKAQDLMASIFFTVGLGLKACDSPEEAAGVLEGGSAHALYEKGRRRADRLTARARALHAGLLRRLLDTPNTCYRETAVKGLGAFFRRYDPDFTAHEIHITADYPVYLPLPRLAGIEFILAYLHALSRETQFCRCFSPESLHSLLSGCEPGYPELVLNLFGPALTAALGCVIAGVSPHRLDLTEAGVLYLRDLFSGRSGEEITAVLRPAARRLGETLRFSTGVGDYVEKCLPLAGDAVAAAIRAGVPQQVFPLPRYPEAAPRLYVSLGRRMDGGSFRAMAEEIARCRFSSDKLAMIRRQVRSLGDLEDVLLEAELAPEEMEAVLGQVTLPQLAALVKRHLPAEGADEAGLRPRERLLRACLRDFVASLPRARREAVAKTARAMVVEEW